MNLMDKIKTAMRSWLAIAPGTDRGAIVIEQPLSFDAHVLRNRVWYRGDASEIESFFKQTSTDNVSRGRFWAASPDIPIRKIHLDIPSQMVDRLSSIISGDFDGFHIDDNLAKADWEEICKDNIWSNLANASIAEVLCTGDGAYKISIDPEVSKLPIIEFYGADRITPIYQRGRLKTIIFHTLYTYRNNKYRLDEHYNTGKIESRLFLFNSTGEKEVPLTAIPETQSILPLITFAGGMLAVYLQFFNSPLWADRGASILSTKSDAFDALDEVISEWWDDYRKGRVKQFMPDTMFPRDPSTGAIRKPNGFDDMFVLTKELLTEDGKVALQTFAPDIRAVQYQLGYAQALDMALMGIISPSTLGIDLKKTDNAEAQREKEKATLWTRLKIVDGLNEAWPKLIQAAITAIDNINNRTPRAVDVNVMFGEYASPSFDTQLQSMGVAAQWNLLSVEAMVNELWGDTKDDDWKVQEVMRIKELRGVVAFAEPAVGQLPGPAKPVIEPGVDGN